MTRGAARQGGISHWVIGGCCAVALHVGLIVAVLAKWESQPDAVAAAPVIMLDLSPPPAAPDEPPTELQPAPRQIEAEPPPPPPEPVEETKVDPEPPPPEPVQEAKLDPVPEPPPPPPAPVVIPEPPKPEPPAEVALPAPTPPPPPPPKPKVEVPKVQPKKVERTPDKPKREKQAKLTTAPAPSERSATRQAAPVRANIPAVNPNALPNWKSQVAARLQSNKRYPDSARSRGEQGVATLSFSVDRSGRAVGGRIARSSGSSALDQETLALLARASPFPPPPPEVRGGTIAIVVPIRYNIR